MRSGSEKDYCTSSDAACGKKENRVDLLEEWKNDQNSKDSRFNLGAIFK